MRTRTEDYHKKNKFESRHKIGDTVTVNLYNHGKIRWCTITAVKFTDYGKVLYDVRFEITAHNGAEDYPEHHSKKLYDIDSEMIEGIAEEAIRNAAVELSNV